MLTNRHIVIMGGDARQIEVINKLIALDAHLSLVGFDQLDRNFNGASKVTMDEINPGTVDSIILPVSGTSQEGIVETTFSNEKVKLTKEWVTKTPEHCVIYSGITTRYLNQLVAETGRGLVKLFARDDVAIYNSIPTVEGTLMMVIQNTDITIHDANVIVLGLGRTGMSVARAFHALGAHVKVGSRNPAQIARAIEMGVKGFYLKDLEKEVEDNEICINTIPALVLTSQVLSRMPASSFIMDIASLPGGTDFRFAKKRGIKAIITPGLPGMVAPKTAGRIIANVLAELLHDNFSKEDKS
ncbi:dipicolinic acid synthetase subunit A [Sporolactobacillus inulinus]|jgi:dipicolinate synthase subunit A|uniref:Dipicolinate synthase subunit A n=2 Tax=Sporolactobacillus inulinus TaxID=2078 RepID=A0A4Y1Z6F1_9BACL|nr:dipicolinic acid synthetase subunit A [Sporolactobacillus inulinus]KLI01965.1 dipicolinate synthase subunit A [Sporolactobacillus inulinus CASD]GAY74615.1 dipicolinate synthase subunit A [Sporolactobacillus inulinus]GEB75946.1 dipicolinate synthase subunit A [Sporolactobacillus inulinus]